MADVIPFAPKEDPNPEIVIEMVINGRTVVSQIGQRLELPKDLSVLEQIMFELTDTLEAIRAVHGQIADNSLSEDCPVRLQSPVPTLTGPAPANDTIT